MKGIYVYCHRIVADETIVPKVDDDAAWQELAKEHKKNCEWVVTRAFWLPKKIKGEDH